MNVLESLPEQLGTENTWTAKGHALWLQGKGLNVRDLAKGLIAQQARFITITATQLPEEQGIRMDYHWDLDGQLLGFELLALNNQIESIYDLCEAANWIEREIHEYFAVDFTGRVYEPLFLRQGDKPGVNLREEEE